MKNKILLGFMAIMLVIGLVIGGCAKPAPAPPPPEEVAPPPEEVAPPPAPVDVLFIQFLPPPPEPPKRIDPILIITRKFAEEVTKQTEGRVNVTVDWATALGPPTEFHNLIGGPGLADAGMMTAVYQKWVLPLAAATGLPFITSNMEVQSKAAGELYETWTPFHEEFDKANMEMLYTTTCPPYAIGSTVPIRNIEDFKGKKLFGAGYYADIMEALGVKVAAIPGPAIYENIEKGVIDGAFYPYTAMGMFGWDVLIDYALNMDFVGGFGLCPVAMNKDVWNKISPADQKLIKEIGQDMVDLYTELTIKDNLSMNEIYKEEGITFYELSREDQARVEELAGLPIVEKWLKDMEERGEGALAQEFLERYKELIEKYEAISKYEHYWPE